MYDPGHENCYYQENAGHCGASLSERSICAELCVELKIMNVAGYGDNEQ